MHPEIEAVIKLPVEGYSEPNEVAQTNADKLLSHITRKGLYQTNMLNKTWTGGLSIYLTFGDWQFHMQANNEGRIVYILFRGQEQLDCGSVIYEQYTHILSHYLNAIKFSTPAIVLRQTGS
jgi:hypothetical protein